MGLVCVTTIEEKRLNMKLHRINIKFKKTSRGLLRGAGHTQRRRTESAYLGAGCFVGSIQNPSSLPRMNPPYSIRCTGAQRHSLLSACFYRGLQFQAHRY